MKKLWFVYSLLFLFLVGCNSESESELSYSEVEISNLEADARDFFESNTGTYGNYLYTAGEDNIFVMINGKNVTQGEEAIHFTDLVLKEMEKF
ncbi:MULTISPECIES: hypothetical protein [Paraliobacillus]|uniref:hypothetical protein n=1 Tax=Paraliobacillus TaxID=200903 RepID=UPI000DD42F5B|nr:MULTISPECIES: hypothetical protein [Paraliobacillus]